MALTEIEKQWDRKRADLKDEKERADFDAYCEKSKEIYFVLKRIGLWPKNLDEEHLRLVDPDYVCDDDLNDARAVVDVLRELYWIGQYDLAEFWDWLKKTLNAALRGEDIDYSRFELVDVTPYVKTEKTEDYPTDHYNNYYDEQNCGDMIEKIMVIRKLVVDAGVTDVTPDSWKYLNEKVEWASFVLTWGTPPEEPVTIDPYEGPAVDDEW